MARTETLGGLSRGFCGARTFNAHAHLGRESQGDHEVHKIAIGEKNETKGKRGSSPFFPRLFEIFRPGKKEWIFSSFN
jgi:hypothetical protein